MSAKRVLIVDGDADSRTVYRTFLQHYGYEVLETADGETGVQRALDADVAAVVTELTLRRTDGHTLVRRLRENPATRELCVIVVTARALPEERERAELAGCSRFLPKPLEPKALVEALRDLIGDP